MSILSRGNGCAALTVKVSTSCATSLSHSTANLNCSSQEEDVSSSLLASGRPRLRQIAGIKKTKCALVSETEGTLTFGFNIPTLHSGEAIEVKDDLLLYAETIRERDVQATTADGVNVTLKAWGWRFGVRLAILERPGNIVKSSG